MSGDCTIDVRRIIEEMNGVLKRLPIEKAVEDPHYIALHELLMGSPYVPIVDEFERVGGKIYGRAHLVPADSARAREIYGKAKC